MKMYPRFPWEPVPDRYRSAKHTLGTSGTNRQFQISQKLKHVVGNKTRKKLCSAWTVCVSFLLHIYRNRMSSITILGV